MKDIYFLMFSSILYIVYLLQLAWILLFFPWVRAFLKHLTIPDAHLWAGQSSAPCASHITVGTRGSKQVFLVGEFQTASPKGHSLGLFSFSKRTLPSPSWATGSGCLGNRVGKLPTPPSHSSLGGVGHPLQPVESSCPLKTSSHSSHPWGFIPLKNILKLFFCQEESR